MSNLEAWTTGKSGRRYTIQEDEEVGDTGNTMFLLADAVHLENRTSMTSVENVTARGGEARHRSHTGVDLYHDSDDESIYIREELLQPYLKTKRDRYQQKHELRALENVHKHIATTSQQIEATIKQLQDELVANGRESMRLKRKMNEKSEVIKSTGSELKRLRGEMTSEEVYELAKRELKKFST